MNKNWLYRVLALALVAMLALPMFALAEDVLADQAEAPAAAGSIAIGGEEEEAISKIAPSDTVIRVYANDSATVNATVNIPMTGDPYISIVAVNFLDNEVTFSSNKSSVASVDASGNIWPIGQGKATISVKGKNFKGKKVTRKITLKVVDTLLPVTQTINAGTTAPVVIDGLTVHVLPGQTSIYSFGLPTTNYFYLWSSLFNDTSAITINDAYAAAGRGVTWKTSNSSVVGLYIPESAGGDVIEYDNEYLQGEEVTAALCAPNWPIVPLFKKPGKATVTVTSEKISGSKATKASVKFVVDKNKATITSKADQKAILKDAKAMGIIVVGIQDIEVKDTDTVVATLFFANGTGTSITSLTNFDVTINTGFVGTSYLGPVITPAALDKIRKDQNATFVEYDPENIGYSMSCNIKKNALSTVKVTFNNVYMNGDIEVQRINPNNLTNFILAQPMSLYPYWQAVISEIEADELDDALFLENQTEIDELVAARLLLSLDYWTIYPVPVATTTTAPLI